MHTIPDKLESQTQPVESSDVEAGFSDASKEYVDAYTLKKREFIEHIGSRDPWHVRFLNTLERLNRNLWYKLFRRIFHNPTPKTKLPIRDLKSVFIVPFGDAIGDMVVAIPLYRAIKRRNPNCHVGIIASDRNLPLLRCDPDVDTKYKFLNRFDFRHYTDIFRARRRGYDLVVNMHLNHMTEFGLVCNVIAPKGTKVSTSHPRKEMYKILFNTLLPFERNSMHLAQLGLMMLDAVVDVGEPLLQWESRPTLAMCSETETRVSNAIDAILKETGASWFIYFNTQARTPFREWGIENTVEFVRQFSKLYPDCVVLFTASPVRQTEVKTMISAHGLDQARFFDTSYDLLEVAALANRARLVITPDTSVIHFGVAEGTPTIVLWADRDNLPLEWIPLLVPSVNLAPQKVGDPVSSIPVDEVMRAAIDIVTGKHSTSHTSFGSVNDADILYQASANNEPITSILRDSSIPMFFPSGALSSIPYKQHIAGA
jgi:heptosyltransferase-3